MNSFKVSDRLILVDRMRFKNLHKFTNLTSGADGGPDCFLFLSLTVTEYANYSPFFVN